MGVRFGMMVGMLVAAAVARGASAQTAVAGAPDSSLLAVGQLRVGRAIFHGQGQCVVCHGARLEGGPAAPPLTAHPWKDAKDGSYTAILAVVNTGVPGTAMVRHPGGISDDQARQVAAYVWAVGHGVTK
jgi:mono/diheme cytochrome c family protein